MSDEIKFTGYCLTLENYGGWLFLGTSPEQIGQSLIDELEYQEDEDIKNYRIVKKQFTQKEIDDMPEFHGW